MIPIRLATPRDANALAELGRQTFCETFQHYLPGEVNGFLDENFNSQLLTYELRQAENRFWLAEQEGKAIAYAKLGAFKLPLPSTENAIELHKLYVLKEWQGKKIGYALMERALARAHAQNARSIYLGVWEKNLPAQQFYTRFGFQKIGEYDYPPIGSTTDREWIMQKLL